MAFSLAKYIQENQPIGALLYWRLLKRGVFLFALGVMLNAFGHSEWSTIRLTGVMQRISLPYLATAVIVLKLFHKVQWGVTTLLLLGYWAAYAAFPILEPSDRLGNSPQGEIGTFGIMSAFGMMSTIAIVLLSYFLGAWLQAETAVKQLYTSSQSMTLVLFGLSSMTLGQFWSRWLPINKKLWTSSYALFTVERALLLLAACHELIEVRRQRRWSYPVQVLGLKSILVFVASELGLELLERTHVGTGSNALSSYIWLDERLFLHWTNPSTAGFLFALAALLFWWLIAYGLYRRHWIIKF